MREYIADLMLVVWRAAGGGPEGYDDETLTMLGAGKCLGLSERNAISSIPSQTDQLYSVA